MPDGTLDSFQISPQQERLWTAESGGPAARTQAVLTIAGKVEVASIEDALRLAVSRHESLRTTFAPQPGLTLPLQVVGATLEPSIQTLDLSESNPQEQVERLERAMRTELEAPFDFQQGPLVRALLAVKDKDAIQLVLTLSALCADQVSTSLLLAEVAGHLVSTEPPEDPLQYADFSAWQHELEQSDDEEARAAREFWRGIEGTRSPSLPFARADGGAATPEQLAIEIDVPLARSLAEVAERYGTTPAALAQTAWHAVLGRLSGEETVTVAFVPGERRHRDLEGALGAFARPVPIQARVDPTRSFAEVLAELDRGRSDALVRQDYAPAGPGAAEIGFVEYPTQLPQSDALRFALERMLCVGPQLSLAIGCGTDGCQLSLSLAFDPARYRHETAAALADGLVAVLKAVASDPGVSLADVQLVSEQEQRRLLRDPGETPSPVPQGCVHDLIARWALSAPDRLAVVEGERSIAYAELDARANQLAQWLRKRGVGPDAAVGLLTDRSIEMTIGLLGILKAGAAYVPLHHEHPSGRLCKQLETAGAVALVAQEGLLDRVGGFGGEVVCLDRDRAELEREDATAPESGTSQEDLAYVIFTSGSTGTPKGVAVTHRNVVNYATDIVGRLGAEQEPLSFGLVSSISTDLGNTSVFGALCSGGTLVLVAPDVAADPGALANAMDATPVDVLKITPSHIGALLAAGDARVLPKRWLVVGGELASWDLVERVRALSSCSILNHYGPTETTVGCCTFVVGDGPGEYEPTGVPIGRPIANTSCYVLDDRRRAVPVGVPGRLFVAGEGVARGYAGEPELTAERFFANPFASRADARMYDTGDLVRWLPDGALEFLGRADEQIKIRGYRVEPAEIETALRSHPGVREAVAVARPGSTGETQLVAYCTVEGTPTTQDDLKAHLAGWLPEFMMPAAIAILDELPRTPSGKVDRLRLPDPSAEAAPSSEYTAPRTPLEETLATIWSEVLGVPRVGIEDDFFALGGHSLLATQIVARVRSDFAIDLPLHSLFTCPTVASLAAEIVSLMGDSEADETAKLMAELEGMSDEEAQRRLAEDTSSPELAESTRTADPESTGTAGPGGPIARQLDGPTPLSSPQERLFLLDRMMPGLAAYNVPTLVRVGTTLDEELLRGALNAIVARHEILRTSIHLIDGEPTQEVASRGEVELTVADLRSRAERERGPEAERILGEVACRSFDLAGDVLLRAALVHLEHEEDLLLIVFHHLASDHASSSLLFGELDQLYTSLRDGAEPSLPELPIQYGDYARWQRERLAGHDLDELLEYWTQRLAGAPERLELPADRPRPSVQSHSGRLCQFELPREQADPLRALARSQEASLFMVLLAGFKALIHRYTGAQDIVLGSPVSGREHEQTASLLGYFSNTLALRTDLSGDPAFNELLARVKLTTLQARAHQELPFEKLVEALNPERDQSHSPIFQVLFGFHAVQEAPTLAGCTLERLQVPGWRWSRFDLSIVARERADGSLHAQLEYATDLFDASTVERLIEHYRTVLAAVAEDPERRLSELSILPPAERTRMLVDWNATAGDYDGRCLHEQFADQAARRSEAIAVADADGRISYGELDRRSNQLARELVARGVRQGDLVAICMERCVDLLVAMLGVLRAGAAYVPIEPTYPRERQELLLADAQARVLITQERHFGAIDPRGVSVLCVDRDRELLDAHPDGPLEIAVAPDALAYVIYTSGSTGEPKGVAVAHRSVANLIAEMRERPGIGEDDVLANLTTPSFDLSVPDWYLPLTSGARLAIVPREATLDGVQLADWLARSAATIVQATPTTWQMLVDAGWRGSEQLKIVCGGEALPRGLAEQLLERGACLWHMYGPTETTVWSSAIELTSGEGPTPLGGPIANTRFYVLDRHRQPTPIGVPGELYIGGDGLAQGYHRRDELTAEKFIADPFASASAERLYRTGDLVRWRESGTLEFLGRIDHQIKLRGFRIELEEIESALSDHPTVGAAVATVREDLPGDRRLVAYVVAANGRPPEEDELRRSLKRRLPPFMIPSTFVALQALPVNANGKLDRAALPAPNGTRPELERPYAPPQSPMQETLASIWREVLGIERVGIDDDFFDLGGHSMLAVKMLARVRDALGLELQLGAIFERPTIRELAGSVTGQLLDEVSDGELEGLLADLDASER